MRTKAENFQNAPKPNFDLYASFVPILKPLPHSAQFLHVSAAVLFIGQLYSYCPEAPNGRVKYVAHRASCIPLNSFI